jgi:hypothetical protein
VTEIIMPRYIITERAGRFVAGHTNTGVGTVLELTDRAAAHELRLGTLVAPAGAQVADQPAELETIAEPVVVQQPIEPETAPAPKPRRIRGKTE